MITFVSSCLGIAKNHGADREGSNDRWVESLSYWKGTSFLLNVIFHLILCCHSKTLMHQLKEKPCRE